MERRLGRGLDSLLSGSGKSPGSGKQPSQQARATTPPPPAPEPDEQGIPVSARGVREIPVGRIRSNPFQPRLHFDEEALAELAESLKAHGFLQAVVVRQRPGEQDFELIAGERRWRAAQLAGFEAVRAMVKAEVSDDQMLELAMVENLQRRDLDPIERAKGYQRMSEQLGLTQTQVAERVGLRRSTVSNQVRLLELSASTQSMLAEGTLSMGHARALLGISDDRAQGELAQQIVKDGISVREVERLVREMGTNHGSRGSSASAPRPGILSGNQDRTPPPAWVGEMERRLRETLGTKVEVRNQPGFTGQIVLHYNDRETLERIADTLSPQSKV